MQSRDDVMLRIAGEMYDRMNGDTLVYVAAFLEAYAALLDAGTLPPVTAPDALRTAGTLFRTAGKAMKEGGVRASAAPAE